jgi:hypothetical protein
MVAGAMQAQVTQHPVVPHKTLLLRCWQRLLFLKAPTLLQRCDGSQRELQQQTKAASISLEAYISTHLPAYTLHVAVAQGQLTEIQPEGMPSNTSLANTNS